MKIRLAAAALVLALTGAPAMAQTDADVTGAIETNFGDAAPFIEAFDAIQAAVADDDAETFAEWVNYPFAVTVDGEDYSFEGPEGVIEHYQSMMTDEIKAVIVGQQYKDLFVNAEGVMFGDGQLWLNGICQTETCDIFDVRIITVQGTGN